MSMIKHRQSILKAMKECDTLGQDKFLKRYGFGLARRYSLIHDGKSYDSKAIVGVAYGYENPTHGPLKSSEFEGGKDRVQPSLEALGFEVQGSE